MSESALTAAIASVVWLVYHRREEVRGGHDRRTVVYTNDRCVVTGVEADEQVAGSSSPTRQVADDVIELAGWDLAGAPATVRGLRQPNHLAGSGHGGTARVPRRRFAKSMQRVG
jgi:hypothetical protein